MEMFAPRTIRYLAAYPNPVEAQALWKTVLGSDSRGVLGKRACQHMITSLPVRFWSHWSV